MSPCYQTVKALAGSQANFILTNPNLPDCPIIFASQGFLELTGYEGKDVIGRNCRFLQGPGTDEETLSIVRNSVEAGRDASVCILNYKKDGTPFWNQLSIGVLLDAHGQVANHVAVMYEVNPMAPAVFHRLLHRVPLPESLLNDDSSSESDGDGTSNHRRDPVERSEVAAGSFNHSCAGGISSRSSTAGGDGGGSGAGVAAPRVVDRLRRTRAAAAAISNGNGGNK
uniref:Putative LOV domain-containing protein n=1 Tax=Scytosiphon lomentaria TaxID=27967 RepID=A0A126WYP3_SCYLO|nr:putative LOV domain-containing protein [Scytosiphon lomentaria]